MRYRSISNGQGLNSHYLQALKHLLQLELIFSQGNGYAIQNLHS